MIDRLIILCSIFLLINSQPINQPTTQPLTQPIHQPINQPTINQPVIQSLDGDSWSVQSTNQSLNIANARVPGSVYLDLYRDAVLSDLFYRFNPVIYEFVTKNSNFTYMRKFDLMDGIDRLMGQELVLYGVDTLADVRLNGRLIMSTINQFRRFTADVTGLLQPTDNVLEIAIISPFAYSSQYKHQYPYDVRSSTYTFVRKTCNDFGWDWSPAFANIGIHGSVELRGFNYATIADMLVVQQFGVDVSDERRELLGLNDDYDVALNVTLYLRAASSIPENGVEMTMNVDVAGLVSGSKNFVVLPRVDVDNGDELQPVSLILAVKAGAYQLWWPNGYGNQPLYNVTATIEYSSVAKQSINQQVDHRHRRVSSSVVMDSKTRNIGFRRVFVRRLPIKGQPGRTFLFEVNGSPLFMKGSNLVPVTPFHINDTEPTIRFLQSALESHQTIVRVWGGGLYPNDEVFDWCDRNGLMMWQEFIYANSFYPVDDEFLNNAKEEANQQIRRLSSHASLVVWCGNNEIEGDLLTGSGKDGINHDHALIDYNNLFTNVIRAALVRELGLYEDGTPHIEYLMSSPANGPISLKPFTWAWGNSRDLSDGDMHFYNYNDDVTDPNHWPMPRFLTETGLQSYPSFITFEPVTAPEDWSLDSPLMANRQHHPDGNKQQLLQIQRHFIVPNATDPKQRFDDYVYISQATSSIFYGTLMAYYRTLKDSAPAYTHGAMYWSLNDAWQAPTWASIEVDARWKQSHYAIKRAFSPVMIYALVNQSNAHLQVSLVSDLTQASSATWTVQLIRWSDGKVVSSAVAGTSNMPPLSAHQVFDQPVDKLICSPATDCFFRAIATFTSSGCATGIDVEQFWSITPIMNVTLPDPKIRVQALGTSGVIKKREYDSCHAKPVYETSPPDANGLVMSINLAVTSVAPAAYAWLESPFAGRFTDNSFLLLHDYPKEISFLGWEPFDADQFMKTLQVRSIRDTYTRG